MTTAAPPITPPPWSLDCNVYLILFYHSSKTQLPIDITYSSLEAKSPQFSSPSTAGAFKGSLGAVQVIQYTSSPVGPYNELAISPGYFDGGESGVKSSHLRITGIWVDSEASLLNGRQNWNIPKHLARFEFTLSDPKDPKSRPTGVKVFHDTPSSSNKSNSAPSQQSSKASVQKPFFTAQFQPISYTPRIPFSSTWLQYVGFPAQILQPPLPEGEPANIVVGTEDWKLSKPILRCSKAKAVWVDMKQEGGDGKTEGRESEGRVETDTLLRKGPEKGGNWWPGMRRWQLGFWCSGSTLDLGDPEILNRT